MIEHSYQNGERRAMEAKDTVRFLPNEYRECADEDGVIRKYKVPIHEPSFKAGAKVVAEELRLRGDMSMNFPFANIRKEAWQDYLKELGILAILERMAK